MPKAIMKLLSSFFGFFFNDTATTEIYTLSLHDALPLPPRRNWARGARTARASHHRRGGLGQHLERRLHARADIHRRSEIGEPAPEGGERHDRVERARRRPPVTEP